jgi:HEAT repeats
MTWALWLIAAALPLAAQPKLLVNAQVDTRSAAGGLDREFRALESAQPQPAWVGYDVPLVHGPNLGCDYVRDSLATAGVVHLEPPDHAVILFRIEANAVNRIRTLSPDCEIDAGGLPVHWLTGVKPAESVALLATFAPQHELLGNGPVSAIAVHADPAADVALETFIKPDQPDWLRQRAASLLGAMRGRHGLDVLKQVIVSDPSEKMREHAISGISASKEPAALDVLISAARSDSNPRVREQAISALSRKPGPQVLNALSQAIENDPDAQVKRRAISLLQTLPDGAGIPLLIQVAKTSRDPDMRKQAMNSLGRSQDPRALAFFEQVLKQ